MSGNYFYKILPVLFFLILSLSQPAPAMAQSCTDTDNDTYAVEGGDCGPVDCDDSNAKVHPGAQEVCGDDIDNDCNSLTDEAGCVCPDADGDGFTAAYCGGTDCDDTDPAVHQNCQGFSLLPQSEAPPAASAPCTDNDNDTFSLEGGDCGPVDCDDSDANVHPGAAEVCDGKDTNCDGWKAPSDADKDGDGVTQCGGDCNDNDPSAYPGAPEICGDGIDNNCNWRTDEAGCVCPDADGDGFTAAYCGGTDCDDTDPSVHQNCAGCTDNDGDGIAVEGGACGPVDCDDSDANVHPGAAEVCDGKDTNCDGWKSPTDRDDDGDGVPRCANDCNDFDPSVYPGAPELCDGIDNNCDYILPLNERDSDGDGYRLCDAIPDCNDNDPYANPGAQEACGDLKDNNCDGQVDEAGCVCPDNDGDGFTAAFCGGTDCDDSKASVYPGAIENCSDGLDNDCDGLIDIRDPNAQNCPVCTDSDGDGYYVEGGGCGTVDCDDGDPKVHPGAAEVCDGKDSNCDGWKPFSDVDNDNDGVAVCAGDCNDNDANVSPNVSERHFGDPICSDGIDNDCDGKADALDSGCAAPSCETKTSPKQGPHFTALLNPDNTIHPDNTSLSCGKCHNNNNFADPIRFACQRCHADPADTSDPLNGVLKAQYPLPAPYGFGSAPSVAMHSSAVVGTKYGSWTMGSKGCVVCHNPHTQEQNNVFGTTYGMYVKEYVCYDNQATGSSVQNFVQFSSMTGSGSFADGSPYNGNICNMCHTQTNHHQNDGTAPGGQDHNNGQDCMACHPHGDGFAPSGGTPAPPHDVITDCTYCHVSTSDFTTEIPDSKCSQCHTPTGVLKGSYPTAPDVTTHQGRACVGCHEPMFGTSNLKLLREDLSAVGGGTNVVFTAFTGGGSFADGPPYPENVCETCHTLTNHHQSDGTAPGGQDHNNGTNCVSCHPHGDAFAPTGVKAAPPHDVITDCTYCHVNSSDFSSVIPDSKCEQCHTPGGVLKGSYPTAPDVTTHQGRACVGCHEPMFGTSNLKLLREDLSAVGGGTSVVFTAFTGAGSFADGPPYPENVCETCHTLTNHHQSDGTAPGGQDHNNGSDCVSCHPHGDAFAPTGVKAAPPHDVITDCTYCHVSESDFAAEIPDSKCGQCHTPGGVLKGSYPAAPDVETHQGKACVGCHEPMFGTSNLKLLREDLSAAGGGTSVVFTSFTDEGSFADGPPYPENVCETCHTLTNHHQSDGTAPGGQDHNNGQDCMICHPHGQAFVATGQTPVAPHDAVTDCDYCHVSASDLAADIPDEKCQQCHSPTGALKAEYPAAPDVLSHQGRPCVGCHEPMFGTSNLKLLREDLSAVGGGTNVVFTAFTGEGSFADGPPYPENVCETCHTSTNHHQSDGTAPGGQDHNNGTDCAACHPHGDAFAPTGGKAAPPHDIITECTYCHVNTSDFTTPIPDFKCEQCHTPTGALKAQYPTAPDVVTHSTANGSGNYVYTKACVDCHEPMFGTSNLSLVRNDLSSAGGGSTIVFTAETGPDSFADGPPHDENVCESCHTMTNHHRSDGTAPGDLDAGTYIGHYDGQRCTSCHDHSGGFLPGCTGCHGYPPVDGSTLVSDPGTTGSETAGAHDFHVNIQGIDCENCHYDSVGSGPTHNSGLSVTMGFSIFNGQFPGGEYNGQSTVNYNSSEINTTVSDPGTGAKTCSNIYCHSNVQGDTGIGGPTSYASPQWDGGSLTCTSCHGYPPATGTHLAHMNSDHHSLYDPFTCDNCHLNHDHVNGNLEVSGNYSRLSYNSDGPPGNGYGFCSGACHQGAVWNGQPILCWDCHGYESWIPELPPTPAAPTLIPEPDIVSSTNVAVMLEWNAAPSATGPPSYTEYYVEVDDSPAFNSINYRSGWITNTSWTITVQPGMTWNWRVRARDAIRPSAYSVWQSDDFAVTVP